MKEILSTSEAAKVAKISVTTVIRCFDAGLLRGFRIPGSRFRKIARADLIQFMRDNGIPFDSPLRTDETTIPGHITPEAFDATIVDRHGAERNNRLPPRNEPSPD